MFSLISWPFILTCSMLYLFLVLICVTRPNVPGMLRRDISRRFIIIIIIIIIIICMGCRCNNGTASESGVAAFACCRLRVSSRSRSVRLLYTSLFTVHVETEKKHSRKHTTRKVDKKHKNTYPTNN